jgi:tRNA U38,U39,U40 pseudouridine synthase TruA
MREALQYFLGGEHDYRNFCKMDPGVTNFKREIFSFTVEPVDEIKRYIITIYE